ncbi:hypothetical protein VP01_8225g1, partial [Puccinia sorghi]
LTGMRTRFGIFEYTVMPFGICNAPLTFQHFFNDIFADLVKVYVMVYLDYILVYSKNFDNHVQHVQEVLKRLQENNTPFLFTEKASKEFDALKKAFTMAPIIAHFIAAVISQYSSSNLLHPKWRSYLLSLSEPFEVLTDKELLLSEPFKVPTDHNALKYFMSSKFLANRLDGLNFFQNFILLLPIDPANWRLFRTLCHVETT